jgi:hypothetical protein
MDDPPPEIPMRLLSRPLLAAAAALAAGCMNPTICTLIGCVEGVTVRLQNAPAGGQLRVELLLPDGTSRVQYCPTDLGCTAVFFENASPERAVVRVSTPTATHEQSITPAYARSYPNGRRCDSGCVQGTATVVLPG